MFNKVLDRYCRILSLAMAAALGGMVILVFTNVVLRYAFNSGIAVSEELSRWLFVWVTFMGAVVSIKDGSHLGTDTLVSRLSLVGKKTCFVVGHLLMIFICGLLFKGTLDQVKINWTTTSAAMEASMAIFYGCGLVLSLSGGIIILSKLWRMLNGQLSEDELIGIRESEEEPIDTPQPVK